MSMASLSEAPLEGANRIQAKHLDNSSVSFCNVRVLVIRQMGIQVSSRAVLLGWVCSVWGRKGYQR